MDNDTLRTRIRDAGLRVTAPRLAVLQVLTQAERPHSHADVVERLESWDRATLWRNLNDLAEGGILRRIEAGDHTWRFEIAPTEHDHAHAHFTCTVCGDLSCIDDVIVTVRRANGDIGPIDLSSTQVHLRGICDDCS